jgi:hypothetical protein
VEDVLREPARPWKWANDRGKVLMDLIPCSVLKITVVAMVAISEKPYVGPSVLGVFTGLLGGG